MANPYRANLILLAPYGQSIVYLDISSPLPITARMELGHGNYMAAPSPYHRFVLGYPQYPN
jgi:hypothetical protein